MVVPSKTRIDLNEVDQLYQVFSDKDGLPMPDYAVFKIVEKTIHSGYNSPIYPAKEYVDGNIPEGHEKLRWHTERADGEYIGKFDVTQLICDEQENVSTITAIHEYLHYRNRHKGIEMTEDQVEEEARQIYANKSY